MRLICYKAMCGDAFHLQFEGESGKNRNLFFDMGHPKTYSQILKNVVSKLVGASEQIDALFLSHIHDDHIGGASRFIRIFRWIALLKMLLAVGYTMPQENIA